MFKVFGVTGLTAQQKALKKMEALPKKLRPDNPEDWGKMLHEEATFFFDTMKPVAISGDFGAPMFAEQYLKKVSSSTECRSLQVRARCPKLNLLNEVMVDEKTKKPLYEWVALSVFNIRVESECYA